MMQTLPTLLKTLRNETFRYWSIPCIVLTLHLQTHLFSPLKQALRCRQFTTDQQLNVTVHVWLVSQAKTFYSEVIKQILWWWTKCIVKQGGYGEKLCSCKISALVFLNIKHIVRTIIDSPSCIQNPQLVTHRHNSVSTAKKNRNMMLRKIITV
jgi:hypothetical protein